MRGHSTIAPPSISVDPPMGADIANLPKELQDAEITRRADESLKRILAGLEAERKAKRDFEATFGPKGPLTEHFVEPPPRSGAYPDEEEEGNG